jgi:DNA-binding SARP family transcriptional activator/TolB-like protein
VCQPITELRALGTLSLHDASGRDEPLDCSRPKQLALLCHLMVAQPRGPVRRDVLLRCFWPESDDTHARGALRQALHGLRARIGAEVLVNSSDGELAVNRDACLCDVWAFEDAVEQGNGVEAVRLYGGSFLAGFHLHGVPDFERWVDSERERLARMYRVVLEQLAQACEERGAHLEAVEWRERLVQEQPYDGAQVLRLMEALTHAGERARALQCAERYETLLSDELDAEPEPDIRAFTERLRAHPKGNGTIRGRRRGGNNSQAQLASRPELGRTYRRRARFLALGVGLAGAGLALAGGLLLGGRFPLARQVNTPSFSIGVLAFTEGGSGAHGRFGQLLTRDVREGLSSLPAVEVTGYMELPVGKSYSDIGRHLAIEYLLVTNVLSVDQHGVTRVRVSPQLIEASTGMVVWAPEFEREYKVGSLTELAADIVRELAADVVRELAAFLGVRLDPPEMMPKLPAYAVRY